MRKTRIAVCPACNAVPLACVVGSAFDDLYAVDEFETLRAVGYEVREIESAEFRTGPYKLAECQCGKIGGRQNETA